MEGNLTPETDKDRLTAYRSLRNSVEKKLKKGRVIKIEDYVSTSIGLRLRDGSPCLISQDKSSLDNLISISVFKDDEPLGPQTHYVSNNYEAFVREDFDPQAGGMRPAEEYDPDDFEAFLLDALKVGANKGRDAREGVDSFPITAEEAKQLAFQIRTASVDPTVK